MQSCTEQSSGVLITEVNETEELLYCLITIVLFNYFISSFLYLLLIGNSNLI